MKKTILGLSVLAVGATLAHAASVQDLGTTLTPLGGDKAAGQGVPEWKAEKRGIAGLVLRQAAQGLFQVQG